MGLSSIRFAAEPMRSATGVSIGASYAAIGTALAHPARQFMIVNHTDALVAFSFDGVNDHFVLGPTTSWINDLGSNRSENAETWNLAQGTILYAKQVAVPTVGSVYFSVFYGAD